MRLKKEIEELPVWGAGMSMRLEKLYNLQRMQKDSK